LLIYDLDCDVDRGTVGPVAGSCDYGTAMREFFSRLRDCQLLKKDFTPLAYLADTKVMLISNFFDLKGRALVLSIKLKK